MELLNSFSFCIFVNCYLQLSKKTDLWEILSNNYFIRYLLKISKKLPTQCYYVILEHFSWKFSQTSDIENETCSKNNISFNFYHRPTSTMVDRKANNYTNIKITHPISLTFFSKFLSFDSRVFFFFVFCISSSRCNKLNSISCGICLSFKNRHLELSCEIIIQLFSTSIFLGLWSRGPPWNFIEQPFFLHSCE